MRASEWNFTPLTMLGFFSASEWQDLSFTFQKSEKTTYLDNLSILRSRSSLRDEKKIQAESGPASYVTWGVCWGV